MATTTPATTPTISGPPFRISRLLNAGVLGGTLACVSCVGYQRHYKIPDAGSTRFLSRWFSCTAGALCGFAAYASYLNEDHKEAVLWGVLEPVVAGCLLAYAISPNDGASNGTR